MQILKRTWSNCALSATLKFSKCVDKLRDIASFYCVSLIPLPTWRSCVCVLAISCAWAHATSSSFKQIVRSFLWNCIQQAVLGSTKTIFSFFQAWRAVVRCSTCNNWSSLRVKIIRANAWFDFVESVSSLSKSGMVTSQNPLLTSMSFVRIFHTA